MTDRAELLAALNAEIRRTPPFVTGSRNAVTGEGPLDARLALVGEQPGDVEDRQGRPFAGPAGGMLDMALGEAGIDRSQCYVTNACKHFKFEPRGKVRLHKKPTTAEVKHYRWWLMRELEIVAPQMIVALGATAALALTGRPVTITRMRGPHVLLGRDGYITIHPSYLLRLPDEDAKAMEYERFVKDLQDASALSRFPPAPQQLL